MDSPFDAYSTTCSMFLEPILNTYYKTYQNIITFNDMPKGPIARMVKPINPPKLSPFQSFSPFAAPLYGRQPGSGCVYALHRYPNGYAGNKNTQQYMGVEDIPSVFGYLRNNGYTINTDYTEMIQRSHVPMGGVSETRLSGNRIMICIFSYDNVVP